MKFPLDIQTPIPRQKNKQMDSNIPLDLFFMSIGREDRRKKCDLLLNDYLHWSSIFGLIVQAAIVMKKVYKEHNNILYFYNISLDKSISIYIDIHV